MPDQGRAGEEAMETLFADATFVPHGELRVGEPIDGVYVKDGRHVAEVRDGRLQ